VWGTEKEEGEDHKGGSKCHQTKTVVDRKWGGGVGEGGGERNPGTHTTKKEHQ